MACPACKHPIDRLKNCAQLDAELQSLHKLKAAVLTEADKVASKGKIEMTAEAADLLERRGGTMAIDFIKAVG